MAESKGALKSSTILAALAMIAATVAGRYGIDIGDTNGWVSDITALIAAVVAIKGRYGAVTRIQGVK
jgi:hypothetical protein